MIKEKEKMRDIYLDAGINLTLLDGKRPTVAAWQKRKIPKERVKNHKDNLGWVLGEKDFVIDVDKQNGGLASFKSLCKNLNISPKPSVSTPSGGFHCYMRLKAGFDGSKLSKTLPIYKGIDFLKKGNQCVIAGSSVVNEEGDRVYYKLTDDFSFDDVPKAPVQLLNILASNTTVKEAEQIVSKKSEPDFENLDSNPGEQSTDVRVELPSPYPEITAPEVKAYLHWLDGEADYEYDAWLKTGMALHSWDSSNAGLKVFDEWSSKGAGYEAGKCEQKWRSFDEKKCTSITMGTLVHKYRKLIEEKVITSEKNELLINIIPVIRDSCLPSSEKERAVQTIKKRLTLLGHKKPIDEVRKTVGIGVISEGSKKSLSKFVYVMNMDKYVDLDTLIDYNKTGMNLQCSHLMPVSQKGTRPDATTYIKHHPDLVKVISYKEYHPDKQRGVLTNDAGHLVLNKYDISLVPVVDGVYTEAGLKAVELIKQHFIILCGDEKTALLLTQWLAHVIQHKGKLIGWGIIIQSIPGVGKSFIRMIMEYCLGDGNVNIVAPKELMETNNAYVSGSQLVVAEEMKIKGHNRFDAANALKPCITDKKLKRRVMREDPVKILNVTNYIAFTNFKDAMPIDRHDRRWMLIFSPVTSIEDIKSLARDGLSGDEYLKKLWWLMPDDNGNGGHLSAIHKYLAEYPITKEFYATHRAPMTKAKQSAIDTQEELKEWRSEIIELLSRGGSHLFNEYVISFPDFFDVFCHENMEFNGTSIQIKGILKDIGYTYSGKQIKVFGVIKRFWTKGEYSNKEIVELLHENSLTKKFGDT